MLKLGTIDEFKSLVSDGRGFAKSNLYYLKLPTVQGINPYDFGLVCTSVTVPTRQLSAVERRIGMTSNQIVHGYVNPEVSATFRVLNDQKVRDYFQRWMDYINPQYDTSVDGHFDVSYPSTYQKYIHLYQLERGESFPLFNVNKDVRLGPININIDLDVDLGNQPKANYHWVLSQAFPRSFTSSELSDASGEISTITVEFSYKNWTGQKVKPGKNESSIFGDLNLNINI